MKKIIYLLLFGLLASFEQANSQENKATNTKDWDKFYKFFGENIKYPEKAKLNDAQGNSIILLTIADGVLKNFTVTNVNTDLGFDEEVIQKLFAYGNFSQSQSGNYVLVTSYRIADSKYPVKNQNYAIPKGYSELKLTVMGFGSNKIGAIDTYKTNPAAIEKELKVIIGGANTANLDTKNPMIILNDEVILYDLMKNINPNTIKSVSILKDASAIIKYGKEAIDGVIIIETKDYVPKKTDK